MTSDLRSPISDRCTALDPLRHPEWDSSVAGHPGSCFFHGSAWARVLQKTYGHRPFYFSRVSDGQLAGLLPVMEVASRWTGTRGVSLPFSDFCPLLETSPQREKQMFDAAVDLGRNRGWRYLECRSGNCNWPDAIPSLEFYSHVVDLTPNFDAMFKKLHESTRRAVRKAEKGGVQIEFHHDFEAVESFYALHCLTRRRHGLPPQPFRFFENIHEQIVKAGQGFVALARLNGGPIAAAVFFHDSRQALYKFGASDLAFQEFRPNHLLMWKAIQRCAENGLKLLHFGRTSLTNDGLRRFKLSFGSREEKMSYYKFHLAKNAFVSDVDRAETWMNSIFRALPLPLLRLTGRILYPGLS